MTPFRTRLLALSTALLAALATVATTGAFIPPGAQGAPVFAPVASATITPGVQMITQGAQCTANYVFRDKRDRLYLGYAAHCAGLGEATQTNGCTTGSVPLGTPVRFEVGGSQFTAGTVVGRGRLAYSSWATMQRLKTTDPATCAFNDFALVRIRPADRPKVNPSIPSFGGPTRVRSSTPMTGETVLTYGSSSLRLGLTLLSPKRGLVTSVDPSGWVVGTYTLTPGIPGDSGSGFLDAAGQAFGVLSTLALAPLPGENGVISLRKALSFAQRHSGIPGLRLVPGTEAFGG